MVMKELEREQPAFVCSHVFEQTRPVLLISHADGDWQFLCGDLHDEAELPVTVGLNHLLEVDATLEPEVRDLAVDREAERSSVGAPWERRALNAS